MNKKLLLGGGIAFGLIVALGLVNYIRVERHISAVLEADSRNESVSVWAYYNYGVPGDSIVFDLRDLSLSGRPLDVTRVLLQFADRMKDRHFQTVYLAWQGERRFQLEGDYFHRIGQEYEFQNPVYTIRTLPENVEHLDGSHAYPNWTGGWLGVLNKQLNDSNQFNKDWYLNDLLNE